MNQQRILPLTADTFQLEEFAGGANTELVAALVGIASAKRHVRRVLYLWGGHGSGKSLLLTSVCGRHVAGGGHAAYLRLPAGTLPEAGDISSNTLLAMDDIQHCSGDAAVLQHLLGLYERTLSLGGAVVVSGIAPLPEINFALRDLQSRLAQGATFKIAVLSDLEKREALIANARRRGLNLDSSVIDYMMNRYPRDTRSLFELLARLDSASLRDQRKITIPFLRSLADSQHPR